MGEKPEQTEVSFKPLKYIGYAIALACSALLVFWNAAEAPDIDIQQMQVTEGLYDCVWQGGGRSGFTGAHLVDGVAYYSNFTYFFGITAGLCIKELQGRAVRIHYLAPKNAARRLTLELVDLKSGARWGPAKERQYQVYEKAVSSVWIFYLGKIGLLILVLRFTCWNWLKAFFKLNRQR